MLETLKQMEALVLVGKIRKSDFLCSRYSPEEVECFSHVKTYADAIQTKVEAPSTQKRRGVVPVEDAKA